MRWGLCIKNCASLLSISLLGDCGSFALMAEKGKDGSDGGRSSKEFFDGREDPRLGLLRTR